VVRSGLSSSTPQDIALIVGKQCEEKEEELDPVVMEEALDWSFCEPLLTVAISLMDRALFYFGGVKEKEKGSKKRFGGVDKEKILERLGHVRAIFDEFRHLVLTNLKIPFSYNLKEIWSFRIDIEGFEHWIEEIEYRGLVGQGRHPTFNILKAKITNKFAKSPDSYAIREGLDHLMRLADIAARIRYLRFEISVSSSRTTTPVAVGRGREKEDIEVVSRGREKEEIQLFGREREKEQIVQWLIKQPAENSESEIFSTDHIRLFAILGVAGMGKTALAKVACQEPIVSTIFDFVVWVQVPYDFTTETIAKIIMETVTSVSPEYYSLKFLQHALTGKRLLLVLDDTWEDESVKKWEALVATLSNCKRGSSILLTTRMQSVVDMAAEAVGSPAECLELDELGKSDNLLLFMSRLPSQVHSEGYYHLRLIGEQIAENTGGCPLVTEKVASWLGSCVENHHWNAVLQKGWQKLGLNAIFASSRLSYERLPSELQICFRYFSIFPKGYKFNKVELANMWISSGLIPFGLSKQDDTGLQHKKAAYLFSAEDVGEQYFAALVRKSFFCRLLETDPSNGNMKEYYVLHNLMHDCAQFVARNECARVDDNNFQDVRRTTVHLSIAHCGSLRAIPPITNLRTLIIQSEFCLDQEAELMLGEVLRKSARLRLLYLDVPSLSNALDEIPSLTQLRYLFLFSCDKSHIRSILKLCHLQVFKLKYFTGKQADLDGIRNMRFLRCLHVPDSMLSKILKTGMPTTLQELQEFEVAKNDGHMLSALSTLTNLKRLSLRNLQNVRNCKDAMEIKLKDKPDMMFLSLSWNKHSNDPEDIDHQIIDNLEPNKGIQQLHVYGYNGVQLPVWIETSFLIHLVSLELQYCMEWRTLPSFKELSSLKYLKLEHLFQLGSVIEEQSGSIESDNAFLPPLLNTLIVRWCPNLKKLPALPCTLEKLIIRHVGLAVLPRLHQAYASTCESLSVDSRLSLLHIESCAHLTSLDGLLDQQQHLQHLKTLLVRHCAKLCHLPANGFTELHHLNFLEIVACPMLRNVKTDSNLFPTSLNNLDINPCCHIEASVLMSLPNLTYLRRLSLVSCSSVEKLPSDEVFRTLKNLNDMLIARCESLLSLGGLGAAASLRTLSILYCDKIYSSSSPQAGCSFMLWKLKVDREAMLLVEPIKSLRYTLELHIGDDYAMDSLPEEWLLQNASSLRLIEIGVAKNLQTLPTQMEKLVSLQSLHIEKAPRIQFLPKLPFSLNKLTIWGCDPRFLKLYERNVGSDWGKIENIDHVDMKAYSEGALSFYSELLSFPCNNQLYVIVSLIN
jgi:hypothetical protein